jgi:hypothetical protein
VIDAQPNGVILMRRQTHPQTTSDKVRAMAITLTKAEIGLLKELRGAGELGRLKNRLSRSDGLARLVKANFVKVKPASLEAAVYFITSMGSHALERSAD